MKISLFPILGALLLCASCGTGELNVKSPDGDNIIAFQLDDNGAVTYSVKCDNRLVITPSATGYELKDGRSLTDNFEVISSSKDSSNEIWQRVWGQREFVVDNYNGLTINLKQRNTGLLMNIIARAYDDGVAFRYEIPKQANIDDFIIMDELTEFNFAGDYKAWWAYGDYDNYEKPYYNSPISDIGNPDKFARRKGKAEMAYCSNTPMTIEVDDDLAICVHEAHLYDYPDMSLENMQDGTLKVHLTPWVNGDVVRAKAPMQSPWRTLQMGSAVELAESDMLLNLNPPTEYADTSWIETFKYIGIWWEMHIGKSGWATHTQFGRPINKPHGATTANAIRHIDFAAKHGIEQVLIEGWASGWDNMVDQWRGYGIFDWRTPSSDFDLERVYAYAAKKGVRIMAYAETISDVDHFEPAMNEIYALYRERGANTAKMGYTGDVNYDTINKTYREHHHGQYMVRHYNKMVLAAADNKMMIINHEPVKYTGEQRTYPNLMAKEGARGQEYNAWSEGNSPEYGTIIPFTRLMAGPMDYTPGIFKMMVRDNKGDDKDSYVKSTLCKELAFMLTIYSPIQMAADLIENYEGNPAFQFIEDVATDWSDSKVMHAKIGDYYTVARKEKGTEDWYVGSVTDENERDLELDLSEILEPTKEYEATIYADGKGAHWKDNPEVFEITKRRVTAKDKIMMHLAPGGGQAIIIMEVK